MDRELEKILLKLACSECEEGCPSYRMLKGNCAEEEIKKTITQFKSLFKKKAKECVWYWFDTRTHYGDDGEVAWEEPLKKRKIVKKSPIIDMINQNIDQKFK